VKIAILSRGRTLYSTRRIAEAGRRRNHDVRVIDPTRCCVTIFDGKLGLSAEGLELNDFDLIIPRVGSTSMEASLHVLRQFEFLGTPSLNSSTSIANSKDKVAAHQILAKSGITTPHTAVCRDLTILPGLIEQLGGPPVIIKVTRGTHGAGVVVAETIPSAASILDTIWGFQGEALLQEYIREASGEDIRVLVVGEKVVGAMKRSATNGDFRANLHLGGTGEPMEVTPEIEELAIATTRALGLDIAGVDILTSHRGPLVIEANASPGLQGIESTTGIDIARHIINFAEQKPTK